MSKYVHCGEKRLVFFAGPEAPEPSEQVRKEQTAEVPDVDTEAVGKQRAEQLAKVQAAERADRAQDEAQQKEVAQKIETQPSREILEAISRVEGMYRQFAIRWSRSDEPIDMTTVDPAMEPIKKAWNELRPGPERTAIENALNAALRRATAETPNVQFHASGSGGSLGIGGSRVGGPEGGPHSERASDRPQQAPTVAPLLQRFIAYLQMLFGRTSMERMGNPAIDRYNRKSSLGVARVSPGTQWNGPNVPGAYNLEIKFKTPFPNEQRDQLMDEVLHAANGDYGANGNGEGILIESLSPRQITVALYAARRWEQAHSEGNRATDQLRGLPLQNRNEVLNSYRQLQTDAQRTYFRSVMAHVSLETQVPLARVLARLSPRMTQDLADGGPLHQPDITNFQSQVRSMSRAEKEALKQLPIGDVGRRLYFPNEQERRGPVVASMVFD